MGRLSHGDILERSENLAIQIIQYLRKKEFYKTDIRLYGQLTASSTSIASNIAEANGAGSKREFRRILRIALREGYEARSQIRIYTQAFDFDMKEFESEIDEIIKILSTIINSIEP